MRAFISSVTPGTAPRGSYGNASSQLILLFLKSVLSLRIALGGMYSGSPSSSSSKTPSSDVPNASSFNPSLILPGDSPSSHCFGAGVSGAGSTFAGVREVDPERRDRLGFEAEGRGVA
jgi:hypothetical protein